MRRIRARHAGLALVALIALEIGSCQVFDAVVVSGVPEGLERDEIKDSAGRTISYLRQRVDEPDLPRLIYVHGSPGDATAFNAYLRDPLAGFESISIDRPGFGRTKPKRPIGSLREQAKCIEPFLQTRKGVAPILIAHSLGAPIIVQAAVDYPDRVGGIVLLSASMDPAEEKVAWFQRVANFAIVPYMIPGFLRNSNRELIPLKAELETLRTRLGELKCKIVIVHAPNDILVPFRNVEFMERNLPADLVVDTMVLEGKNHFVPWNAEDDVRTAIRRIIGAMKTDPADVN